MAVEKELKINQLLKSIPKGIVCQTSWLIKEGFSNQLLNRYKKSNWFKSIGSGAMIRSGDQVDYYGGIYALQYQSGLPIHPGGKTALMLLNKLHYLPFSTNNIYLFGTNITRLPKWFVDYSWNAKLTYFNTSFIPGDIGLVEFELKTFSIKISGTVRAFMECLYLIPKKQELLECYQIMEGLNNLRPDILQSLLEACTSIKVKRLFLYMAEKANHEWLKYLDLNKIDLGSGKRSFVNKGVYISKYMITVPKELEQYDTL